MQIAVARATQPCHRPNVGTIGLLRCTHLLASYRAELQLRFVFWTMDSV